MPDRLTTIIVARGLKPKDEAAKGTVALDMYGEGVHVMFCPQCGAQARLRSHTMDFDAQQRISLNPSLICPDAKCGAHYYIRSNRIDWC